jgi:hypothetical protein
MNFNSKTNENSIILYKNFRISVLKKGIIRIEKSDGDFNDYPTQKIMNRYFPKVNYKVEYQDEFLVVCLDTYKLYFNGVVEESYIKYHGECIKLNNDFNLGGTYETVDGMDGDKQTIKHVNSKINDGICSRNGVALLFDSDSYCFD